MPEHAQGGAEVVEFLTSLIPCLVIIQAQENRSNLRAVSYTHLNALHLHNCKHFSEEVHKPAFPVQGELRR